MAPYDVKHVCLAFGLFAMVSLSLFASPDTRTVVRIPIHGTVDASTRQFLLSRLQRVRQTNARLVLLDVDSPGGRIDYVLDICDAIENTSLPVVSYVTGRALDEAALICFSTDRMYMKNESELGASGSARHGSGVFYNQQRLVDARTAEFSSRAARNGYSTVIAKAMVDPSLEVRWVKLNDEERFVSVEELDMKKRRFQRVEELETINSAGEALHLTAPDAHRYGVCAGVEDNLRDVLRTVPFLKAVQVRLENWEWNLFFGGARLFSHSFVMGLLLVIGVTAALLELKQPGSGWTGGVSVLALGGIVLVFGFLGLVEVPELVLFLVGLILFALDVFVIPGTGGSGLGGLLLMVASLVLVRQGYVLPSVEQAPWETGYLLGSFGHVLVATGGGLFSFLLLLQYGPSFFFSSSLVCPAIRESETGEVPNLVGRRGVVRRPLRPVGVIEVDGILMEVLSEGQYFEEGAELEFLDVRGIRLIGRQVAPE